MSDQYQLRRVHSESRFCLPEVIPNFLIQSSSIIDDESDLLEINLNLSQRTLRSKTEPELINSNELNPSDLLRNGLESSSSSSAIQEMSMNKQRTKQLRDQTTNTPPMSRLTSSMKGKKKTKKKCSSPITPLVLPTKLQKVNPFEHRL